MLHFLPYLNISLFAHLFNLIILIGVVLNHSHLVKYHLCLSVPLPLVKCLSQLILVLVYQQCKELFGLDYTSLDRLLSPSV